ncbi:MAG: sensor histidine kinase [Leucobacter sp.]
MSRTIQQDFSNQQLGDLSYFATDARYALRASNPSIVEGEMERYSELYDAQIAVLDRAGAVWASAGLDTTTIGDEAASQVSLALSGRRSEGVQTVLPWSLGDTVMVEPIFDDGSVIGAVLISASAASPRGEILTYWAVLVVAALLIILVLIVVVVRLSNWVLQPMQRVDQAMAAIEHGQMDARISDDTGPPEMRRVIRMFNQMAEELERTMSRQQEFVMNASHELRNPLGALAMRVETLATGLDETWEEDVEKTREEGRRMSRILDTMLFMAKVNKQDAPFALVDLAGVAADRVEAWREIAEQRGVGFRLECDARVPSITDRTAVESALDAVLDNAVKFAPRGTAVEVTVHSGDTCTITVRDHGPGLDPDELDRVTARFWRSPRDQNVPGSGLGLAIATDLLAALNGEVQVDVADSGGLAVTLRLPAGEAP